MTESMSEASTLSDPVNIHAVSFMEIRKKAVAMEEMVANRNKEECSFETILVFSLMPSSVIGQLFKLVSY